MGSEGDIVSPELEAFYQSIDVPVSVRDILVRRNKLYLEDLKGMTSADFEHIGVPTTHSEKLAHCVRFCRLGAGCAKHMRRTQRNAVVEARDLFARRGDKASPMMSKRSEILYASAGWGSRPASAASMRSVQLSRPQSAPAGR